MKKLYIAYGSNLHLGQMARRCPSARVYGNGVLNNWKLVFRGSMTGAYASIERQNKSIVPVTVWEITDSDERSLDTYEGYPHFYYKKSVIVTMSTGKKKKAMVYIMNNLATSGTPSNAYINTIRTGYNYNGLNDLILNDALRMNRIECKLKKKR